MSFFEAGRKARAAMDSSTVLLASQLDHKVNGSAVDRSPHEDADGGPTPALNSISSNAIRAGTGRKDSTTTSRTTTKPSPRHGLPMPPRLPTGGAAAMRVVGERTGRR